MAVLLHVQGAGRDALRPFGGHLVRTVAWERFEPGSVDRDVDTIVVSAPDPLSSVKLVTWLRDQGITHPVLLVPDTSSGWREIAGVRLPGTDVVLGGISGLPDYLPPDDRPRDEAVSGWAGPDHSQADGGRVVPFPQRVPRGPGRGTYYDRISAQPHDISPSVQHSMQELIGRSDLTAPPQPADEQAPTGMVSGAHDGGTDDDRDDDGRDDGRDDDGRDDDGGAGGRRAVIDVTDAAQTAMLSPVPAGPTGLFVASRPTGLDGPAADPGAPPVASPIDPPVAPPVPGAARRSVDPDEPPASSRRLARAMADPAVLVPAMLARVDRLAEVAGTARAIAGFVRERVAADAVDVVVPVGDGSRWVTRVTVGEALGAGTVGDVVDVPGLVEWLEGFDSPVVLDGTDLAAPGSWALAALVPGAAPARSADGATVALLVAWRRPGRETWDPAAVGLVAEVAADSAAPLALVAQLAQLRQALADLPDA